MSKRKTNDLFSIISIFILLVHFNGLKYALNVFYHFFEIMNTFLIQLNNISVLTVIFKYCITFPIVGILLTAVGSPRGQKGHFIGKVLYFVVGYIIGFILDCIAMIIF